MHEAKIKQQVKDYEKQQKMLRAAKKSGASSKQVRAAAQIQPALLTTTQTPGWMDITQSRLRAGSCWCWIVVCSDHSTNTSLGRSNLGVFARSLARSLGRQWPKQSVTARRRASAAEAAVAAARRATMVRQSIATSCVYWNVCACVAWLPLIFCMYCRGVVT